MKVDTNTKGNSFWFNFKVYNGRTGCTYTFNFLNFSRDLSTYYDEGMGIKSKPDAEETEWENGKCFEIKFEQTYDLVRSWNKDKFGEFTVPNKYFYSLKF